MQQETKQKIEQYDTGQALEIAQEKMKLSQEYIDKGKELIAVKVEKAKVWTNLRLMTKSDAQADKQWDKTPLGLKEMTLVLEMKGLEKRMSAISSMISILNNQAHNLM